MSFEQELERKIQEVQKERQSRFEAAKMQLLENPTFIEAQCVLENKNKELTKLNSILDQLNAIEPMVINGQKYGLQVFPIGGFPVGTSQILGIITGSRSAFTQELSIQYEAITGLNMLELIEAREALGQPAYFSKKELVVVEEERGNVERLNQLLKGISLKLGIYEFDIKVTKEQVDLWFLRSKLNAEKKQVELEKSQELEEFVIQ